MLPVIVLVGRQNVGKSTLFNRLTHTRDALVADYPGLTIDRKYGYAEIEGNRFICIDTSGINYTKNRITINVPKQSLLAIEESDVILFIVDARCGLVPIEVEIADFLRTYKKSIFLVVNKIDEIIDVEQKIADFWLLGFKIICPISASHGRGVSKLMKIVLSPLAYTIKFQEKISEGVQYWELLKKKGEQKKKLKHNYNSQNCPIVLSIVGRPNVGKSTLTNCILGKYRVVTCDTPGTTRDSIYIPMQYNKREYILIDTAGIRRRRYGKTSDVIEKISIIKSLQAIEDSNVVLLIIDAREGIADQDLSLLGFIVKIGRPLVIVVNKWDSLTEKEKEKFKKETKYQVNFINFFRIHFISALYGKGIIKLFDYINEAYENSTRRIDTTTLMQIMNLAVENCRPPLINGRFVKLKHAHVGGYNPPIIVIHGKYVRNLPDSYKRYLVKFFRKSLQLMGTTIQIYFKENNTRYTRNVKY